MRLRMKARCSLTILSPSAHPHHGDGRHGKHVERALPAAESARRLASGSRRSEQDHMLIDGLETRMTPAVSWGPMPKRPPRIRLHARGPGPIRITSLTRAQDAIRSGRFRRGNRSRSLRGERPRPTTSSPKANPDRIPHLSPPSARRHGPRRELELDLDGGAGDGC